LSTVRQVVHRAAEPVGVAGERADPPSEAGRDRAHLGEQLQVAPDAGRRRPDLVGDRRDHLVMQRRGAQETDVFGAADQRMGGEPGVAAGVVDDGYGSR
jgi:hypothetical protein